MRRVRRIGAYPAGPSESQFMVWAPNCNTVTIDIIAPLRQRVELAREERGMFTGTAPVGAGARYFVMPDGGAGRPDPASRYQPEGVHGPSEVVDHTFAWTDDDWRGIQLADYIIYELHIGTFSEAGTFDGAIPHLDELKDLGITAVEIMPVAQFPGARNWGYDGVQPFAVQNSYGGPAGLKRLVDACHARGLAVILDVVYNHMGPEGNYLGEFGPYFTETYQTPWGQAVNVDGAHSDEVRRYFIENALEWLDDYHIDALRLDAVHGILDTSAYEFLAELSDRVRNHFEYFERPVYLIAESDLNDVRMLMPTEQHGMGMHAQWTDDFHHSLHALLTREAAGYYMDFGSARHFAQSLQSGFVYAGGYSEYRQRRHGNDSSGQDEMRFVVCSQNHDQIGNRMNGDRLSTLIDFERRKLAAAAVLLSPYVPLLFMGEEYGETRPFPYFIDHSDAELVAAVRKGRREEFAGFAWQAEPPDPYAMETFTGARLNRRYDGKHARTRELYRQLIELRKQHGLGPQTGIARIADHLEKEQVVTLERGDVFIIFAFSEEPQRIELDLPGGIWSKLFSTWNPRWAGPGDELPLQLSGATVSLQLPPSGAALFIRNGSAR